MKLARAFALRWVLSGVSRQRRDFPASTAIARGDSAIRGEEFETQLRPDCDSLREILGGLDGLEQQLSSAQTAILARQRGYFTPDEDDRVRFLLHGSGG